MPSAFVGDWAPKDLPTGLEPTHPEKDGCERTIIGTTTVHIDATGRTAKSYEGLGISYTCSRSGSLTWTDSEYYKGRVTGCLRVDSKTSDDAFDVSFLDIQDGVTPAIVQADRPVPSLVEGEPLFTRFGARATTPDVNELGKVGADGTHLVINGIVFVRSSGEEKDCECLNCGPSFRDPPRQSGCEYVCKKDGTKVCDCTPNFCPREADWWDLYWLGCTCQAR